MTRHPQARRMQPVLSARLNHTDYIGDGPRHSRGLQVIAALVIPLMLGVAWVLIGARG